MLDKDLAPLYSTETRTLKQAVRRNRERFPDDFMFELSDEDIEALVSQSVIPSRSYFGGATPFAFTEQGVSMLSAVIRTPVAVEISVQIMRAFVAMRQFLIENGQILSRIGTIEQKQIETDHKIDQIFTALEEREIAPRKGIFFDGQVYDAYVLVAKIIRSAKRSLVLIDNYIDDSVLTLFTKRKKGVKATIHTRSLTKQLQLDISKHNQQYPPVTVKEIRSVHDRFLIVDNQTVYHIGASLKDLGKKWFAFSKMEKDGVKIVERVSK